MTLATGVGSMPGEAFAEAAARRARRARATCRTSSSCPARGITAGMVGRTLGLVRDVGVDLQPAGWRLTDASGVDHRRARSLLAQDLDGLEELAQDYRGAFKVQVAGPWTLAATVEKPRGDKVVSDHGARRDLAQALAEGVRDHVRDVRRRVAGAERLVVQVDEPALAAVAGGGIRTASGLRAPPRRAPARAHRAPRLGARGGAAEGAEPWVHSCAPETPYDLLRGAGAARPRPSTSGVVDAAGHDVLATALEAGETVALGVVPSTDAVPTRPPTPRSTERVLRWLDMLGLDPEGVAGSLVVTPACGLAGATPAWARRALQLRDRHRAPPRRRRRPGATNGPPPPGGRRRRAGRAGQPTWTGAPRGRRWRARCA